MKAQGGVLPPLDQAREHPACAAVADHFDQTTNPRFARVDRRAQCRHFGEAKARGATSDRPSYVAPGLKLPRLITGIQW